MTQSAMLSRLSTLYKLFNNHFMPPLSDKK
jgi:hypothetical protein